MISKKIGVVEEILSSREGIDKIAVRIDGKKFKAYNYTNLTGGISVEDEVVLNTTSVELGLGTGGYHFVIANLNNKESDLCSEGKIMKLRYTPFQVAVNSVEDHESKYHQVIENFKSLNNLPVVVGTLHSMLAPFAASYKRCNPDKKLVYIMTDGAALPMYFSETVSELKEKGLISNTITIGNAFGGDYECINIYTALITASEILKADAVFVSMGPGIAGTGTKYGFSGIEQGQILDAVSKLGGVPIAVPRISFADKRERHQGISHHTITVLDEIVSVSVEVPVPIYETSKLEIINNQLEHIACNHSVSYIGNINTKDDLDYFGLKVSSMGRSFEEDEEFFKASSACAYFIERTF
jgi:hypothetical protein